MWFLLACTDPSVPTAAPPAALSFDAPVEVFPSNLGQHHATVAIRDDRAFVVFQLGPYVAGSFLDGRDPIGLSWPAPANHPQVIAGVDGFLVAATAPGRGLATSRLDGDGEPVGAAEVGGAIPSLHPDLALRTNGDGLLVASDGPTLTLRAFRSDFEGFRDLPPIASSRDGIGTPTVKATDAGFRLAWSEADARGGVVQTTTVAHETVGPIDVVAEVPGGDGRPALAVGRSGWVVAWRDRHDDLATAEARVRFYASDDTPIAEVALPGPARRPSVAASEDVVLVAWETIRDDHPTVWLQAWDLATATPRTEALQVSPEDDLRQGRPYVDIMGEIGVITWEGLEVRPDGRLHRSVFARELRLTLP